ncbi:GNAT family N-acetyltransferase [Jatrophihabitans sp.]|uniref:GNAT family N-acetyltransferase n=1 Tax=Jatrophihabitans sp. TaxID=1932789 RepID=UPI002C42FD2C|nr:GNAT family N-acetyltransferase [Jatrophihabitans sp.]
MELRPWQQHDAAAVAALLDPDGDPLWAAQGHALHGPAREGERWRRTLVACHRDQVLGAGTVVRNPVHAGRYAGAVEVATGWRRRGVATALVRALRELRPEPLPLAGKIHESDAAARLFGQAMGARPYQRCLCPRLDLAAPGLTAWCRDASASTDPSTSMGELDRDQIAALFEEQYRWVHERWSPVTSRPWLARISSATVADADLAASSCGWRNGRVAAAVFAFPEPDGSVSLVAETQRRDESGGAVLLSAALARSLTVLADRGYRTVELDGHVDDPHLAPVVAGLPVATTDELLLVEVR